VIRDTHAANRESCTCENNTDIDWEWKQNKAELIGDRRRVIN
jgi:hypothetical protein